MAERPGAATFPPDERRGVYRAIWERRDIRRFLPDPVPAHVLRRLLEAAHRAPSVGFMQPWNFVVVQSPEVRHALWEAVDRERRAAGLHFQGERAERYLRLKVEGIREAPVVICVTCDPTRGGPPSWAATRTRPPTFTRPPVPCRISGWPPAPREWPWAG